MCPYTVSVNAADACPRTVWISFGVAPAWIIRAAAECRSTWIPTGGTPAHLSAESQHRFRNAECRRGAPVGDVNINASTGADRGRSLTEVVAAGIKKLEPVPAE